MCAAEPTPHAVIHLRAQEHAEAEPDAGAVGETATLHAPAKRADLRSQLLRDGPATFHRTT